MLDKIDQYFDLQQKALSLRAYRAEVVASNIANAETPNYKSVDFDFRQALQSATHAQSQGNLALSATDARHFNGSANSAAAASGAKLQYRTAVQPSLDGNTVDMDIERAAFTDNALKYQSTLTFLNKKISNLVDAIKGGA